jgi:hypothetical protein
MPTVKAHRAVSILLFRRLVLQSQEVIVEASNEHCGRVTVAGRPGEDLAPGTFSSILKQAGLKR